MVVVEESVGRGGGGGLMVVVVVVMRVMAMAMVMGMMVVCGRRASAKATAPVTLVSQAANTRASSRRASR